MVSLGKKAYEAFRKTDFWKAYYNWIGFEAYFVEGGVAALEEAARQIQAMHPGETKNSVLFLNALAKKWPGNYRKAMRD